MNAVSLWKIFDNLRRSLVPPAMVAVLVGSWLSGSLPASLAAAGLVVAAAVLPPLLAGLLDFVRKPHDVPIALHLLEAARAVALPIGQAVLGLVMLPYEAALAIDAIARTLCRMFIRSEEHTSEL